MLNSLYLRQNPGLTRFLRPYYGLWFRLQVFQAQVRLKLRLIPDLPLMDYEQA